MDDISASYRVKFGKVEVRHYEVILSDHPAVSAAPPIGLGWRYTIMEKGVSVDDWEHTRQPFRRFLNELVVPHRQRANLVFEAGYTRKDIAVANRAILRIKNRRKQTYHNLKFQAMEEWIEKTGRRVKKALRLGMIRRA
jgi:hypothetical protein